MGIPPHTRIVLIPSNENPSREFGISRPMIILLIVLATALTVLLGLLMASFAAKHNERQRIAELEAEIEGARSAVAAAGELAVELEHMKEAQERLLFLFGVQDVAEADSILAEGEADSEFGNLSGHEAAPASAQVALHRAAAVVLNGGPERWPARGMVTQEFKAGNRARNIKPHQGIDIAGPMDTPILAAAEGRVVRAGTDEYLGNVVEIEHGLGYLTVYGHCSRLAVRAGDAVQSGQLVAYMGTSGQSTAVHLHFEIWRQGEAVDPRTVLSGEPTPN